MSQVDGASLITGESLLVPAGQEAWQRFRANLRMFKDPARRAEHDANQDGAPVARPDPSHEKKREADCGENKPGAETPNNPSPFTKSPDLKPSPEAQPSTFKAPPDNIWPQDPRRAAIYEEFKENRKLLPDARKKESLDHVEARATLKYAGDILKVSHQEYLTNPQGKMERHVFREDLQAYDAVRGAHDSIIHDNRQDKKKKIDLTIPGVSEKHPDAGVNRVAYVSAEHGYVEPDSFRGRILKTPLDPKGADSIKPKIADKMAEEWGAAARSGMFTPAQAEHIKLIRKQQPEYNKDVDAQVIAKHLSFDYQELRIARNPPSGTKYVQIADGKGGHSQGFVVEEMNGRMSKEGTWTTVGKDEKKKAVANYEAGILSGNVSEYHDNGRTQRSSEYLAGVRNGTTRTFDANGSTIGLVVFRNDVAVQASRPVVDPPERGQKRSAAMSR